MRQSTALDILKAGRNAYLTGAAGSGKTYVLNEYVRYLRDRDVSVAVTASTGIAATHLGGVTIHSWSGMGIRDSFSDGDIENLVQKERLWKRYDKTKVLIIDEVSMLGPTLFDNLERICRSMKQSDKPFGGMQVVLSGDFFQLPPIVRGESYVQFIDASRSWRNMDVRVCYLEEQFRHDDSALESVLNEMRGGVMSEKSLKILRSHKKKTFDNDVTPTRLYTHNKDVDAVNERELKKIDGEEHVFEMDSKGRANLVESLKRNVLTPEELKLKKGASVMFVKNSFDEGYVNGTLGIVEDFEDEVPVVRTFKGDRIHVYRAEWSIEEDGKVLAQVMQIPLRLAWAITIHKSQGMSLDAAEIDLSKSFVPGQGYVALSRLRSFQGLVLSGFNDMTFAVHPDVAHLDRGLHVDSRKWEKALGNFSPKEMEYMHHDFITNAGGITDKDEIEKNKKREKEGVKSKIPTHEITKTLTEQGLSLPEIAKERGMTVGTIISHFEKLQNLGGDVDLSRFKPKAADLKKIKSAFAKSGDTKLAPVRGILKGEYSYEDLRLARLFV